MIDAGGGDGRIKTLLEEARRIAVVGLSPRPERPSHRVAVYLINRGYDVIPVNPGHDELLGRTCYPSLGAVSGKIDIVNIFRRSEQVTPIVDEAIEAGAGAVWMQLGIVDEAAAIRAELSGITVVMDRCIKVDHSRLFGG